MRLAEIAIVDHQGDQAAKHGRKSCAPGAAVAITMSRARASASAGPARVAGASTMASAHRVAKVVGSIVEAAKSHGFSVAV
ncbi:hypothetical protein [Roseovarius sp. SYSU LYC5161]|jgi:hypothetical protein|uniref:hypothetical protein n=1 Tax=Roseovarius halophilus (ex Wu et al. 2025) TaxID=3376060 RepID=UPI00399A9CAC